jgi:hypothetical protein
MRMKNAAGGRDLAALRDAPRDEGIDRFAESYVADANGVQSRSATAGKQTCAAAQAAVTATSYRAV